MKKSLFFILPVILLLWWSCGEKHEKSIVSHTGIHPKLQMGPVPQGLGVNIHFNQGNENDLSMIQASGIGMIRMDISWVSKEKEPGVYDFSQSDKLMADMEKMGIRILYIVDYGNPLYNNGKPPTTPEGLEAYAKFCRAMAERYAGKDIIWELWNEPNLSHFWFPEPNADDYMRFCQTIVPAIRKGYPGACIVAPATSRIDHEFIEKCFEQGLLELIDGVSVHPYRNARLGPETTWDEYQFLSLLIEKYAPAGKKIPILSGEWGYSTTHLSRELQGKYLPRQWLSNIALNIPVSIWYDWHDDGQDPENAEHNFGTVTWDYKPKPSYIAMQTLTHWFRGYEPAGRFITGNEDDYMLIFHKDDHVRIALWTTDEKHTFNLGDGIRISKSINYLGDTLNVTNPAAIKVSDEPLYLEIASPYPEWLQLILTIVNISDIQKTALINNILHGGFDDFSASIIRYVKGAEPQLRCAAQFVLFSLAKDLSDEDALKLYYRILNPWQEKLSMKMALMEIAKTGDESAAGIVNQYRGDPKLFVPVSLYFLNIAYREAQADNEEKAKKLLSMVMKLTPPRYAVERVLTKLKNTTPEDLKTLARSAGFINQWKVIGPFPNKDWVGAKIAYPPEKIIDFSKPVRYDTITAKWLTIDPEGIFPVISFDKLYGRSALVAYAATTVNADHDMEAILKIGSNDGVVCWVNGKKVHENHIARGLTVDEDVVKVKLNKGENSILLKVLNEGNAWEACLRVCDDRGRPMDMNLH